MEKKEVTGSNEDEEPQMCTVFSSNPSTHSAKTIFDTIAFSVPKKENSVLSPTSPFSPDTPPPPNTTSQHLIEQDGAGGAVPLPPAASLSAEESAGSSIPTNQPNAMFESLSISSSLPFTPQSYSATYPTIEEQVPYQSLSTEPTAPFSLQSLQQPPLPPVIGQTLNEENLRLVSKEIESLSMKSPEQKAQTVDEDEVIPTANVLFSNTPEVPFPVGVTAGPPPLPTPVALPTTTMPSFELQQDAFSNITYATTKEAPAYDAWIPTPQTKQILQSIASSVNSGTYFPDKANMTTPGVIYKEDLVDKVAVNMSRIFGEAEASKRQILTADNVPQDDNGIRELIKVTNTFELNPFSLLIELCVDLQSRQFKCF